MSKMQRKRMFFVITCVCISLCTYVGMQRNETIQTSIEALNTKVIVIDPGHGIPDRWCYPGLTGQWRAN